MISDSQGKAARLYNVTVVWLHEALFVLKKCQNWNGPGSSTLTTNISCTGLLILMRIVMKRKFSSSKGEFLYLIVQILLKYVEKARNWCIALD